MDTKETDKVTAFDTLFTNNHIQMLKIMLPYMDNQAQKSMAVYIKFLELNYTLAFYRRNPYPFCGCTEKLPAPDITQLCTELLPYCTGPEKRQLETIQGMMKSMNMYQEMQGAMELMKDFMPQGGFAGSTEDDFDITSMLLNMLTPEQKQMYELFTQNKER